MPEARQKTLGRYEVIGDLATGGMAEILLARLVGPSGFERLVVIKRIFAHLAKDPGFVTMFLDEARTVARINHPNVVQVHELAKEDGDLFLAMEYLEGETVSGLLRRLWSSQKTLDSAIAAHVVAEACRGLQAAHDLPDDEGTPLDLVHRDVSPQNLFITYGGAVKILDFGIAKLSNRSTKTEPGQIKGKYAYMSPEQCAGKNLDRRSDVFSLGIVLHELLTGHRLFARPTEMETLRAVCEGPIAPPSRIAPGVPAAIESVCLRALERRREERYASCAEMRKDLLGALRNRGSADDPEAALAALMQSLYPDRIEEKREMVRRVRLGHAVEQAPAAEIDVHVELPQVDEATRTELVSPVLASEQPSSRRATGRRVAIAAGVLAVAILASAAGWLAATGRPSSAAQPTPPAAATSPASPRGDAAEPKPATSSAEVGGAAKSAPPVASSAAPPASPPAGARSAPTAPLRATGQATAAPPPVPQPTSKPRPEIL